MKKESKRKLLKALYDYLLVFLFVGFIITCCTMLFVSVLAISLDVTLTSENVSLAANITFLNVVVLSAIFTLIDGIRRKITVERPVKRIIDASKQISCGNFDVRIPKKQKLYGDDSICKIADCFNDMAQKLSANEELQSDFISNVSHELKTPLSVMKNYAKLLEDENLTEEKRREYAVCIGDSAQKMSELVTNILRLNKLENRISSPNNEAFDLGEQLCECFAGFENEWEKKKIEIEADIQDGVVIESDRELLSLVWNNLISNAIKFTDDGGKVCLSLTSDDEFAYVSVSDTGCGISRSVGERMFDKFYQGDTSHSLSGNGLGLALVKRVVDITASDISVESRLGEGSTFTVKIKKENK